MVCGIEIIIKIQTVLEQKLNRKQKLKAARIFLMPDQYNYSIA